VRESHGTERKLLVSALAQRIRETVGVAAEKNDFAGAPVAEFAEPFGERVRIEIFSASVEQDHGRGAVGLKFFDGRRAVANFGDFDRARSAPMRFT